MSGVQLLRLAVLVLLCVLLGSTLAVTRLYWHAWRHLPADRGRLTPLHVALVSTGLLLMAGGLAWAIMSGLRTGPLDGPALARLGMYGAGAGLILASLWVIAAVQRRRVRFVRCQRSSLDVSTTDDEPPS